MTLDGVWSYPPIGSPPIRRSMDDPYLRAATQAAAAAGFPPHFSTIRRYLDRAWDSSRRRTLMDTCEYMGAENNYAQMNHNNYVHNNNNNNNIYHYNHPNSSNNGTIKRILLTKDPKDRSVKGGGLGMKVIGGKMLPHSNGRLGAYVAAVYKGGVVETLGEVTEGDEILEWNGIPLGGKTYEEVQRIISKSSGEIEIVIMSDANLNAPVELKQSTSTDKGYESAPENKVPREKRSSRHRIIADRLTLEDYGSDFGGGRRHERHHGSACFSRTARAATPVESSYSQSMGVCGYLRLAFGYDIQTCTLFVSVLNARELNTNQAYPNPFVKIYLLPGRTIENKRRTKYLSKTSSPDWEQTVVYKDVHSDMLVDKYVELTVWDYQRDQPNRFLGQLFVQLSDCSLLDGRPRWFSLNSILESADGYEITLPQSDSMPMLAHIRPYPNYFSAHPQCKLKTNN